MGQYLNQLFIHYEKVYDLVGREVLYNILTEIVITLKLGRLIKMHLNGTYNKVHIGKNLSDAFHVQNGLNKETLYHYCFRICYQDGTRISG
jgi:hypothetical protein